MPIDDSLFDDDAECEFCGQRGLHLCPNTPEPRAIGLAFAPIVGICVHRSDLYVATADGVFILDPDDGKLHELEIVYREPEMTAQGLALAGEAEFKPGFSRRRWWKESFEYTTSGQVADYLAGLAPMTPAKPVPPPDPPFEPRKFGEHGD